MFSDRLNSTLKRLDIAREDTLLVAFSGGPDSTALVSMLVELGFKPALAYVDYHDSPAAVREEKVVETIYRRFGLKLYKTDCEIPATVNFEAEARKIRYRYFKTIAAKIRAKAVFLAHHQDDHIETYLLQKERGGLVDHYGLKEQNTLLDTVFLRPLLDYRKDELKEYLRLSNLPFFNDPTNFDVQRRRNRIRAEMKEDRRQEYLLAIEADNESLAQFTPELARLKREAKIALGDYRRLGEDEKKRLLYSLIKDRFYTSEEKRWVGMVNRAYNRLNGNRSFREYLDQNLYLYCDNTGFFIASKLFPGSFCYLIERPGVYHFKELTLDLSTPERFNVLSFPVTVENARCGDKIATGLTQKDVRNFLKKMKVPSYLRERYPVIKNIGGEVIYVPFYSDLKQHLIPLTLNNFF